MRYQKWMHTVFGFWSPLLVLLIFSFQVNAAQQCEGSGYDGIKGIGPTPQAAAADYVSKHNSSASSPCGQHPLKMSSPVPLNGTLTFKLPFSECTPDPSPATSSSYKSSTSEGGLSVTCTGQPTACQSLQGQRLGGMSVDVPRSGVGGTSACFGDCKVAGAFSVCGCKGDSCQCQTGASGAQFTGENCTDSVTGSSTAPAATTSTSSRPECTGTINGVQVKYPCTETTTSASTTATNSTTPNQATQTTTTTTCKDGKCTTVTTTSGTTQTPASPGSTSTPNDAGLGPDFLKCTRADGSYFFYLASQPYLCLSLPTTTTTSVTSPTVTATVTENQDDFCKKNPRDPLCKETGDSSFSGNCQSLFTCDGDAALCAAAKATNETNCQLKALEVTDKSFSVVGTTAATGQDPSDHPRKNKSEVDIGTFNTTNPFSNQCPPDYTISTSVVNLVLPLSSACSVLVLMGQIAVALTSLACALWLVKG
jgi:hypothetical protein